MIKAAAGSVHPSAVAARTRRGRGGQRDLEGLGGPTGDEESLGELLMHFMLETIIAAQLLGVDAFDQPAVEEGKILAKKYLSQ